MPVAKQSRARSSTPSQYSTIGYNGGPIIDPTKNVLDLVRSETIRQDDLRDAAAVLTQSKIDAAEKLSILRAAHAQELSAAESRRVDEGARLRADYSMQLSLAEAKRIDAIRAVDVNAVSVASQRASDQASVLAAQVAQSAEALRALVATTAATVATSLQQMSTSLSVRLTTLEQAGYQAQGKQQYADPAFVELLAEVKQLRQSRAGSEGTTRGVGLSAGVLAAVVMGLLAFGALVFDIATHHVP
jgi:hypothetical protein